MGNILLIAMGAFWIFGMVFSKEFFLGLVFIIFGLVFGFVEFMAKYYTGRTVSQQVLDLVQAHHIKGMILLACMLAGWICLLFHLGMRFKK